MARQIMTESAGRDVPQDAVAVIHGREVEPEATPGISRVPRVLVGDLAILAATAIWGGTFVMVKEAVANYPVFTFFTLRFMVAILVLLPFAWRSRSRRALAGAGQPARPRQAIYLASLLIGLPLFVGYALQTFGLHLTTPAKAGFITGLSVVLVAVVSSLLLRQSPGRRTWLGVGLATLGLGLLSLQVDWSVNPGDLLVLACAVVFTGHIILTGHYSPHLDTVQLVLGQFIVAFLLFAAAALILETPPPLTGRVVIAIVFTGAVATSLAFLLQTFAQRFTNPTHTALLLAGEPVFAAIFSFLLIGEVLGPRQIAGCALILVGMVTAELGGKHA